MKSTAENIQTTGGRNYGIDLLRIVTMTMVVVLHISSQAIVPNVPRYSCAYSIAMALESLTYCAVNVFAMITGYVCLGKKLRLSRLSSIWIQAVFYFFVIYIIAGAVTGSSGIADAFARIYPVKMNNYWYLDAYIVLFFTMPLLNAIVENVNKKTHLLSMIFIAVIAQAGPTLCPVVWPFQGGYVAAWLVALYLFGAYYRKYGLSGLRKSVLLLIFLAAAASMFFSDFALRYVSADSAAARLLTGTFLRYTSLACVAESVALFNLFAGFRITGKSAVRIISFLSPASFAVYLIHTHPYVFVNCIPGFSAVLGCRLRFVPFVITGCAAAVYLACAAAEHIRALLFRYLRISRFVAFVSDKIQALVMRLVRRV